MQTRRIFLKMLFGLGAFTLPWIGFDNKLKAAIEPLMKQPKVKLYVVPPEAQTIYEYFQSASLNRTAMDDILALSAPEMEGRRTGQAGEGRASQYLSRELSMLGLKPMGDNDQSYAHAFTIHEVKETFVGNRLTFTVGNPDHLRAPSLNILGGLKGDTEEIILISAHYDHLGIFEGQLYPGANDNASGVGCVLDVIRRLVRENAVPKKTLVFAFWSGEEMGFLGSKAFVRNPSFPLERIKAVINVDTIGNGMIGNFGLWADNKAGIAVEAVQKAAAEVSASAMVVSGNGHNSDQITFAKVGIPAVTLLAREWLENNHTTQDTIGIVKREQVELATEIVYRAIKNLAF
ncbi:M28 family metallopeptidase [Desulfitobacterium hafniense]|uniref:M28 family metallopeptidase n=1 Tax=Desulfitobacterium hafniense TaxID=49338 RepID=UPI0003780246|nr:M20/M25/M40 family metallo-hydrolase [Desulfitobacterium hafniense]